MLTLLLLFVVADRHLQIYSMSMGNNSKDVQGEISRSLQERTPMNAKTLPELSWLERSALIWLFFCPKFHSHLKPGLDRYKIVGAAGGVTASSVQKWVVKNSRFSKLWYHMVKAMTWKDVKTYFPKKWVAKRALIPDDLHVQTEIKPYGKFTKAQPVSLSKFMDGAADVSPAKRAGLAKKRPALYQNFVGSTKRCRRSDKGKARIFPKVCQSAQEFIQERWNTGDPCTRRLVTCT